jgi:hypothetical protein
MRKRLKFTNAVEVIQGYQEMWRYHLEGIGDKWHPVTN